MQRHSFFTKAFLCAWLLICAVHSAAQDVKNARFYTDKGDEFFVKSKFDDAIANYTKAISLDSKYATAYASRGYALVQKKMTDLAIQDCTKAINLEPDSSDFYFYRGEAYKQKKMPDSAILDFTIAIRLSPDTSEYYQSRGELYLLQRMYELAIMDYSKLISLDPGNTDYYRQRCKAYYYGNQIDLALQDITKAFSIDSSNVINNNYRGLCYNSLGKYELSILDFLTNIIRLPDNGNPYINIISPLVRSNRFAEAALFYQLYNDKKNYKDINSRFGDKKFESFLSLDKFKFYNHFVKAVTAVANGRFNEALVSLDLASKEYGSERKDENKRLYSDILFLNGFVLEKLDRLEDAKANYSQSLMIDSRQPDITDALLAIARKQERYRDLDHSPPVIKLINYSQTRSFGIEADTGKLQVTGKAIDQSGIASVTINNVPADKIEGDGYFFVNLPLKSGVKSLIVTASDTLGNKTTATFNIGGDAETNNTDQKSFQPDAPLKLGKYYAILIAEKDYADSTIPDLKTPIRDADSLRAILTNQYTFDSANIDMLYNRSREDIQETITARCKALSNNDNLFIFYAGHGDTTQDKLGRVNGYLVPSSAQNGKTAYYITSAAIKEALLKSNAKHILLVLDACYSGAFTRDLSPVVPADIIKQYKLDSRKVMASGNLEKVPDNSVFIKYFMEFLKTNDKNQLSANDVWEYVSAKVKGFTSNLAQYAAIPEVGDIGGQFIFEKRNK